MSATVSVVVTTYNQAPYIAASIRSVLAQTYRDFELIVVDDGSTDSTVAELSRYRGDLKYIGQRNRGVAASRNVGIRHTEGKLLAFLDGDDLWKPEKLCRQVEAIEAHPSSGLVVVDGREFGPGHTIRETLMNPWVAKQLDTEDRVTLRCYRELIGQNLITTMSQVMVPRLVFERIGLSDERFPVSSDWDLYLRIAACYEVTFLKENLVEYRYLPSSASGPRAFRFFRWGLDEIRILRKHVGLAAPEMQQTVKAELARRTAAIAEEAYYHALGRDRPWARRYLLRVLAANPGSRAAVAYLVASCTPGALSRRFGRLLRRVIGLREGA